MEAVDVVDKKPNPARSTGIVNRSSGSPTREYYSEQQMPQVNSDAKPDAWGITHKYKKGEDGKWVDDFRASKGSREKIMAEFKKRNPDSTQTDVLEMYKLLRDTTGENFADI